MIISSSCIGMESARIYNSVRMDASARTSGGVSSFLSTLRNSNSSIGSESEAKDTEENEKTRTDKLSETLEDIRSKYDFLKTSNLGPSKLERDAISRIKTQCLQYLLRMLLKGNRENCDDEASWENYSSLSGSSSISFSSGMTTITEEYSNFHYYSEEEETSFTTTGKVVTASGQEFEFGLSLSMSRSFTEYYETRSTLSYTLMDPLVINLDCDIAGLSDIKFRFDLDSDGEEEEISSLSSGSGFLALDINEDGIINNGSELFGASSGDGFKDLAKYDQDGNGWIDEADEVFHKLKIFTVDNDGNQTLLSLSEKDIGAIYLGNVSTNFSLNSHENNQPNGAIRRTGVFLYESGAVGSIQHVDLAKSEYSA